MGQRHRVMLLAAAAAACLVVPVAAVAQTERTVLGIDGSRFTINDKPTFLLGMSYYGGLGASADTLKRDVDDLKRYGFNWIRVWATWNVGTDVSAVDATGAPREPYVGALLRLVAECDRRGIVVDVTLSRGQGLPDMDAHRRAVETVVGVLQARRNWYLDLANERDVGDARFVPLDQLRELRAVARRIAPALPVTASFGGHDLDERYVRDAVEKADLDFVAPHRPRNGRSPAETAEHTRRCLEAMKRVGRTVPVHYQEPFRRGYGDWQPVARDFLVDLEGAVKGGAAGWCLHNGTQGDGPDAALQRSFDLRSRRLFDQLDADEMEVVRKAAGIVARR